MTHRVITFALAHRETGHGLGFALVAPAQRYASVAWRGATRPDRRFARPADWAEIDGAQLLGLGPGVLDASTPWARVLIPQDRRESVTLQYVSIRDLEIAAPHEAIAQLDALLRSLAA